MLLQKMEPPPEAMAGAAIFEFLSNRALIHHLPTEATIEEQCQGLLNVDSLQY